MNTALGRVFLFGLVVTTAAAAWLSCTTNQINYFFPGTGDGTDTSPFEVRGTIGQEGGSLRVTDPANPAFGSEISIPPGAVSEDTEVVIRPSPTAPPVASQEMTQAGPFVTFEPQDIALRGGARIRISVPALLAPTTGRLALLQLRSDGWEEVEGSADGGDSTAVGEVEELGVYCAAVVGGGLPPADETPPTFAGLARVIAGPGAGQVTLSWDPAQDKVTDTKDIVYYVWTSPVDGEPDPTATPVAIADAGALSIIVAASDGVPQKYLVRARDEAGNFDENTNVVTFPSKGGPGDMDPKPTPDGSATFCSSDADCPSGETCIQNSCRGV